ncbi:DUF2946 family protein [Azonexus sp.]|jgi:hypothetical protein|uniref:DUF2946 family protein n=1 Tax=Azonexus sp. TaxID=1872668 RepID=UPI00282D22CE|nr:DUF2946 family protein [Azonexus sp.]MDR1994811.1 DUF2946 family protein [Azonexus sp.]
MAVDLSAIARWPNVPACYDWLALDRRGDWRLRGERVTHHGLIEFINQQYGCDETGRWFMQNGPQRVFVRLACTPWIFRRADASFVSHTGAAAGPLHAALVDEGGNVLLTAELGIGLLDDRDLPQFLAECCDATGQPATEAALLDLMAGRQSQVFWGEHRLQATAAAELPVRYGFVPDPQP